MRSQRRARGEQLADELRFDVAGQAQADLVGQFQFQRGRGHVAPDGALDRNRPVRPYLRGLLGCREVFFSMVFSGVACDGGFTGGDAATVGGAVAAV